MISHLATLTSKKLSRRTTRDLTALEMSNLIEGHIGSLMGLVTRLYDSKACPDLIAESEDNLLGGFYKIRENGEFHYVDQVKLVERLYKDFDPSRLVCSKQTAHIQFTTKLISQTLLLMDLAGFQVI